MGPTIVMLISIVVLAASLLLSITKEKRGLVWGVRHFLSIALIHLNFIFLVVFSFFIFRGILLRAFIFGAIAGFLQRLADRYLKERTLLYNEFLPESTPVWISALWAIVLTQLVYFAHFSHSPSGTLLFIIVASAYFYACELLVGNFVHWWKRRNCRQHFGVADYAILAEVFTVIIVWIFSALLTVRIPGLIAASVIAGLCIAGAFIALCEKSYQKA